MAANYPGPMVDLTHASEVSTRHRNGPSPVRFVAPDSGVTGPVRAPDSGVRSGGVLSLSLSLSLSPAPPPARVGRRNRLSASAKPRNEGRRGHQGRRRRGADADAAAAPRGAPLLLPLLPRRLLRLPPLHPGSAGGGGAGPAAPAGATAGGGVAEDGVRRVRRARAFLDPLPDFELAASCTLFSTICNIKAL